MDIIVTAAERIFDISRFYDDDDDPEGPENEDFDDGADSNSESSSEDSSEEDSGSEYGKKLKKRKWLLEKSKAQAMKSKSSAEKSTPKSRSKGTSTPATPIPKISDTDEVADIIDKLVRLNLNGPGYASLYFQIVSQAPNTATFLAKPRTHTGDATPRANASTSGSLTVNGP